MRNRVTGDDASLHEWPTPLVTQDVFDLARKRFNLRILAGPVADPAPIYSVVRPLNCRHSVHGNSASLSRHLNRQMDRRMLSMPVRW